ncbi:MAG: sensor histidine kinase [Chloroflexi bacterium]|nr:sensor histidine kinase [Chloroflexota bacterium]
MKIGVPFSLRTKLLGAVLVGLIPVLALFAYDYFSYLSDSADVTLDSERQVAQTVAVLLDASFTSLQDVAWTFADDPVVLTFDPNRTDPYLRQFAEVYPHYDDIAVFDAEGNNVGSMRILPKPPPTVLDRQYFRQVMATNAPYISNILISRATGKPIAVAAVPIRGQQGTPIGVAIASLNLEFFPEVLAPVKLAAGQHLFVTDREGRLAFHTRQPDIAERVLDVSQHSAVQGALTQGQFLGPTERGILLPGPHMIAATRATGSGWVAGVSVPQEVALAPVYDSLRLRVTTYVATLILSLLAALWLARNLSRPIRRLTEHAIALGHGRLETRVKIETGDELQTVGESFNAMADEVQLTVQLRDEFLNVASHELRTPLTTIKGYAQLLLHKHEDDSQREALETIVRSVDRMDHLVADMLEISRIRSQGVQLDEQRFDLVERTRTVVDRLRLLFPDRRLTVSAQGPVEVHADVAKVEWVLTNLIDNAIRYSPRGGPVEIEVGTADGEAIVSVIDHGLGIPRKMQRHVLEPFFQVYPAIAGFGGMGLGLYISKQMIEAHGGRIWFESEEGKGSAFHFSLPLD